MKFDDELIEHFNNLKSPNTNEHCRVNTKLPSRKRLDLLGKEITSLAFPNYFAPESDVQSVKHHLENIQEILIEQIHSGICYMCKNRDDFDCGTCHERASLIANAFMKELPKLHQALEEDASAAFLGDPAAVNIDEVVFAYPGVHAMIYHRIAHQLYLLKTPIIPRIISELAHSQTGIDIHPGAQIQNGFFIDHGTGVVIGETSIIGKNVKIYQGVTLGAKSFPTDENGNPMKGVPRHPIVGDNVTIYAGATILGRITIGKDAVIGGNVWVTCDIEEGKVVQQKNN